MDFLETVFVQQIREERELRWHSRSHAHPSDQYEIHYFIYGDSSFRIQGNQFTTKPGTFIIVPPEAEHAVVIKGEGKSISYYALLFRIDPEDREIIDLLDQVTQCSGLPALYQLKDSYRFFFEELRMRSNSSKQSLRQAAKHQLLTLLYLFLEDEAPPPVGDHRIERALQIMQNSIYKELSLDELSLKLGLSPAYFIRLFRGRMGITPIKYFTKLKIEAASALLSGTNQPLQVIAQDLGFYSEFHFSRVFKQYTGEAPSWYRRRHHLAIPE